MGLLSGRTVYLAGAIEMSDDPVSWRNLLTTELSNIKGLRVWDPLIKPEWCIQITADDQRKDLEKFKDDIGTFGRGSPLDRNREIRETCLRLVSACDFIICKIGGKTIGTFEELAHAAMMKKPVLFIGEVDSCWRVAQFYNNGPIFFNDIKTLMEYLFSIDAGVQEVDNLSWIFLNNKWINHATEPR